MLKPHGTDETFQKEALRVDLTIWLRKGANEQCGNAILLPRDFEEVLTIAKHTHIVDIVLDQVNEVVLREHELEVI